MGRKKKEVIEVEATEVIKEEVIEATIEEVVEEKTDNERLIDSIDAVIEISTEIMSKDRSRVLRLKNLVNKLKDAKRLVV